MSLVIYVLPICLGNICRSSMAEAILMQLVREVNLQAYTEVYSAGENK